ncbi:MAG: hypothetical protein NUW00_04965 [Candidatus Kaiserbacteria bacterium]|nr:hypothetical protein [Candidatus Kaiserbacteria bacterium]
MGGKSTLHSAVLKDDTASVSSPFDLRSWQGLTQVLKVAKESLKESGDYAEFRNLVLQYAQQGGDIEIKKKIDAIIATFGTEQSSTSKQVADKNQTAEEISSNNEESRPSAVHNGRRVKPTFNAPPVSEKVIEPAEVPVAVEVAPIAPVQSAVLPEVKEEASSPVMEVVQPVEEADAPKTLEEYKARITEIKRLVNDKVGNPVSLMNSKDGLGKKYMSALLTALKATSAGGQGNVESAMHDLESAYALVIHEASADEVEVKEVVEENIPTFTEQLPDVLREEKVDAVVSPAIEEELPEPDVVPVESPVENPLPVEIIPSIPEEEKIEVGVPEEISVAEPIDRVEVPQEPERHESFQDSFQKTDDAISAVVGSVHKRKDNIDDSDPLATLLVDENDGYDKWSHGSGEGAEGELQTASQIRQGNTIESQSVGVSQKSSNTEAYQQQAELSSPATTALLNNLLQEWSIFSGSGLFGIGPDGLEHPLYIQLAPLTMGEVMAGRWEKVDPKVLRVIKQYVDAWRHEQSITYTLNETFEHYLRRVVQRIQKRQTA